MVQKRLITINHIAVLGIGKLVFLAAAGYPACCEKMAQSCKLQKGRQALGSSTKNGYASYAAHSAMTGGPKQHW